MLESIEEIILDADTEKSIRKTGRGRYRQNNVGVIETILVVVVAVVEAAAVVEVIHASGTA